MIFLLAWILTILIPVALLELSAAYRNNDLKPHLMECYLFTETPFFRSVSRETENINLNEAYREFSTLVLTACMDMTDYPRLICRLIHAEVELCSLSENPDLIHPDSGLLVQKALSLVRQLIDSLKHRVPSPSTVSAAPSSSTSSRIRRIKCPSSVRWTGGTSDLVELIYGLEVMGCINNGEMPVGEIGEYFYAMLGVDAKVCYQVYQDIKRRKNRSYTHFLDKMKEKIHLKIKDELLR